MAALYTNGISAPGLTSAAILLLAWSLLSFAVRLWVKVGKKDLWAGDDSTISAAFLTIVLHVVTVCIATSHGYGGSTAAMVDGQASIAGKALYASQILYVVSVGLIRISVGLFIAKLTRDSREIRLVRILAWICALSTVLGVLLMAMRGDLRMPWAMTSSSKIYSRWLAIEIMGLSFEIIFWATASWLIWGLHMPVRRKLSISAILIIRFILIPLVVFRLVFLASEGDSHLADIFTELVLHVAFILSSVTCAKPFLRPFHSGHFISTTRIKTSSHARSGNEVSNDFYQMLSKTRSQAGNQDSESVKELNPDRAPVTVKSRNIPTHRNKVSERFRPERVVHLAEVSAQQAPTVNDENGDLSISRTQEWMVSYEEERR